MNTKRVQRSNINLSKSNFDGICADIVIIYHQLAQNERGPDHIRFL